MEKGKMKVQVTMNVDAVERIDKIAESMGLTRSALCCFWIGQSLRSYDMSADAVSDLVAKAAAQAAAIADDSLDALHRNALEPDVPRHMKGKPSQQQ